MSFRGPEEPPVLVDEQTPIFSKSRHAFTCKNWFVFTLIGLIILLFVCAAFLGGIVALANKKVAAQEQPQVVECSNNGFLLENECSCFDCWEGSSCETLTPNCTVDASVANAGIYEQYFDDLSEV